MSLFSTFGISASGMSVQDKLMNIAAENMANVNSTRSPEGGAYKKKVGVVSSIPIGFERSLDTFLKPRDVSGAALVHIAKSSEGMKKIYDPSHIDADKNGFVEMPNVNMNLEMVNMLSASKAYEANITVFNTAKAMLNRALSIGGA